MPLCVYNIPEVPLAYNKHMVSTVEQKIDKSVSDTNKIVVEPRRELCNNFTG